jgi:hypothetical protein
LIIFNQLLAGSQHIGIFCLEMRFDQTLLHKTHDFGQIQNTLDQNSGLNVRNEVKDLNKATLKPHLE